MCSTLNVDMVRSIGTDRAIDFTQDGFTNALTRRGTLVVIGGVD